VSRGIDISRWKNYDDILTDSLWTFPKRDASGPYQGSTSFHGGFIAQIPEQLIKRYTKPGDIVVDLFAGWGTSLIAALTLKRHAYGVELNRETWQETLNRLHALPKDPYLYYSLFRGDAASPEVVKDFDALMFGVKADLTILHPPYLDIVKFSDDPHDLSNMDTSSFFAVFEKVADNAFAITKPGGIVALVVGDVYQKGAVVPLGFRCSEIFSHRHAVLKGIIVKDINGNERGKGKNKNLWRYRHLKNGTFDFSHEYIFVMQTPK